MKSDGTIEHLTADFAYEITELERNIGRRRETDYIMSFPKWIVLGIITLGIAAILMYYRLIKRRNEHFKRQRRIVESVVTILKVKASVSTDITLELSRMFSIIKDVRDEEGEKSAAFWVILSMITGWFAALYVFYFLMRDVYTHSQRQRDFVDEFVSAMSKLGVDVTAIATAAQYQYQVPRRSFAKYLVLSIITMGIFGIFWLYVIFKDWNDHFKTQWLVEDQILSSIKKLP